MNERAPSRGEGGATSAEPKSRVPIGLSAVHRWLGWLALPMARLELPGAGHALHALGVTDDRYWVGSPMRSMRYRWHGARVTLDTSERFERETYFRGRYPELPLQMLMRECIRPGEVFVDVGANLGMITMLGAWLTGGGRHGLERPCDASAGKPMPQGKVFAYEPNPVVFERLRRHVESNGFANAVLNPVALGCEAAKMELSVLGANTGAATLGRVPQRMAAGVRARYRVPVVVGDSVSHEWKGDEGEGSPLMIKMDAEGAEHSIIRGLRETIRRRKPLIVTEVMLQTLRMHGSNPKRLRRELQSLGYQGWLLSSCRVGMRTRRPRLAPLPPLPVRFLHDEVWAHPEGAHWGRIRQFISEGGAL